MRVCFPVRIAQVFPRLDRLCHSGLQVKRCPQSECELWQTSQASGNPL